MRIPLSLVFAFCLLAPHARADAISAGFITNVGTSSAPDWRVINMTSHLGASNALDLLDVSVDFSYATGSFDYFWADIPPNTYYETGVIDASNSDLLSISYQFTLSSGTLFFADGWSFVADSLKNSGTADKFPPPVDFAVYGTYLPPPVPEPESLALVGLGAVVLGLSALGHKTQLARMWPKN
jgi:hypothetical protein